MVETLTAVPAALWTASQRIAERAEALGGSCEEPGGSTARVGLAAAGVYRALDDYRAGFSRRLATVSAELARSAFRYMVMDNDAGAVLGIAVLGIAEPVEQR